MGDRHRSEDDNVERDTPASDDGRFQAASDDSPTDGVDLNRPVSEPPAPGSPTVDRAVTPDPPSVFGEWMSEWEDVRLDGTGSDEPPVDGPGSHVPPSPPKVPTNTGPLTEPDEEPTEPNPALDAEPTEASSAARVPSPPPVRTQLDATASSAPPIRASRPQPVSGSSPAGRSAATVSGTSPAFRVDPPGTVDVDSPPVAEQARQTTSRTIRLGGLDVTVDATQRAVLVTAVVGMVMVAGIFAYLLSGLGRQTDAATRQADLETTAQPESPNLNVSASSPASPSTSELAHTTVRIAGLDDAGQTICAGSGVLVGEEGVILTNAHVVTIDDDCPFSTIAVGVTLDTSDAPELLYRGEVLVSDAALDLAVVSIVGVLSTEDQLEIDPNFPTAMLGDSDQVDLGDNIRILGYPVIGGETITHTTGTVAGFVDQEGIGSRALMKTDASISAGNSGGMAVNEAGEVIGVPTKAGANGLGPPVDCREVSDTNNDGQIDDDDACVPIGGFLNSIRPINLARDLLSRAEAVQQDAGRDATIDVGQIDLSQVSIWNPRFSTGEENDAPSDEVVTVTEGVEELCVFVDWSGIPNGVPWAAVWSYDGEKIEAFSIFKIWEYGESGRNFWYCAEDRRGHPAGVYEIGLFLNDELAFVESIEVTEEPMEIFEVAWVNKTDQDVCGLAVNPRAVSRHAGVNVLDPGVVMKPGDSVLIDLPAGEIVVEAYDCTGMAIAAELDGLSIPEDLFVDGEQVPFVIGGPTAGAASTDTDE